MTDYSKRTKAELIHDLEGYQEQQKKLTRMLDEAPVVPKVDAESLALSNCVHALSNLVTDRDRRDPFYGHKSTSAIERTLKALADRFGVNLVEVRTEPCNRAHVDEIDMGRVADAIHNSRRPADNVNLFGLS